MDVQHAHARQLMQVFRRMVQDGGPPVLGYAAAAEAIGLEGHKNARNLGQVCSRIDAASFVAGWPMLAPHMVRTPNGEINPASFGSEWGPWVDETKTTAANHQWKVEEVDEVLRALDGLPDSGAKTIWDGYLKREAQTPGFVRFNLHRKLGPR